MSIEEKMTYLKQEEINAVYDTICTLYDVINDRHLLYQSDNITDYWIDVDTKEVKHIHISLYKNNVESIGFFYDTLIKDGGFEPKTLLYVDKITY